MPDNSKDIVATLYPLRREVVATLYPPQGIQTQLDKVYIYNPDAGGANIKEITATGNIEVVRDGTTVELRDKTFVFEMASAQTDWVIEHNLNKRPAVEVVDSAGSRIGLFDTEFIDENSVHIHFKTPFKGTVYLN